MAKKDERVTTEDIATVDASPGGDLMAFDDVQGTLARPKSMEFDETGTEDIDPDRVRLPRLAIAQGLSPQMTPGDSQFIEGLTMFDMFNDITGEVYGKGPITFVPVKHTTRRIEFIPRNEGGGVADLEVPKGDVRLKWTKSSPELTKADLPPKATEIEEFVVILLRKGKMPEPIVFGIALKNKWNRRAADKIIATVKLRRGTPIFGNMFTVDTKVPAKNDQGTFGVPTIRDLGFVPKDTPSGAALFQFVKDFHDSLEGKNIESSVINQPEPDIDDSMAANPESTDAEM
jgi:hypothetical protein